MLPYELLQNDDFNAGIELLTTVQYIFPDQNSNCYSCDLRVLENIHAI